MPDNQIVNQLVSLIVEGNAHVTFEDAVKDIPFEKLGIKPQNLPYSIWMLVEHIRVAQADILDFSINPDYKALKWPDEYWPAEQAPKDENEWQNCLEQINRGRDQFVALLNKPGVDLFSPFAHSEGQNLLREALLIADHNSYHTGQVVLARRLLNDWE